MNENIVVCLSDEKNGIIKPSTILECLSVSTLRFLWYFWGELHGTTKCFKITKLCLY